MTPFSIPASNQILLLTGPNMAGKSTYMRQVALIVILAQMGSFVPAVEARIGVVDRIFTRIGAADSLARGESTFMVEMKETAAILRYATSRSLILLDEVGRGTSTYDGVSIAWAVAEYLHDLPEHPKTLFATHYHELTELAQSRERIKNYNFAVKEWQGDIIFLRNLVRGAASRSYGIHVARLAGLPEAVIARAKEMLSTLEQNEVERKTARPLGIPQRRRAGTDGVVRFAEHKLREELGSLDLSQSDTHRSAQLAPQMVGRSKEVIRGVHHEASLRFAVVIDAGNPVAVRFRTRAGIAAAPRKALRARGNADIRDSNPFFEEIEEWRNRPLNGDADCYPLQPIPGSSGGIAAGAL